MPTIHVNHPSSILSPLFTNRTCLQDTDRDISCTIGYYPWFVIDVTDAKDVQASVNFAREDNLRLVVKNTGRCYRCGKILAMVLTWFSSGHDFIGKAIGFGTLSLWTKNLDVYFHLSVVNEDVLIS